MNIQPQTCTRGMIGALIALSALSAAALEVKVWPAKLRVKPGEPQAITVSVDKLPAGQTAAQIECFIERGLAERVFSQGGTASPGNPLRFDFTPSAAWGYEVRATATAGAEDAATSEVFACAANAHMVSPDYGGDQICGFDALPDGTPNPEGQKPVNQGVVQRIEKLLGNDRNEYIVVSETGGSWDHFSTIKPAQANYLTGGGYHNSANLNRYYIQKAHELGLSVVFYVNACVKGPAGTEFAREHPEFLAYTPNGMPFADVFTENYRANQEFIDTYPASLKKALDDKEYWKLLSSGYPGFLNALLDFEDPALSEFGSQAILEGQKYFGYDGVRYDGLYQIPSIGDPLAPSMDLRTFKGRQQKTGAEGEALTLRNFKIMFDVLKKGKPDILIGMNWADFRPDYGGENAAERPMNKALSPGMWILDEVAKGSLDPLSPTYTWKGFIEVMTKQADSARKLDNYVFANWGGGPGHNVVDMKLVKSMAFACGVRWIRGGWSRNPGVREVARTWNRFAMRYGEFILNSKLKRIPGNEIAPLVAVTGSRPVLWRDFAYRLATDQGSYIVLHLVNNPLEEHQTITAQEPPPAAAIAIAIAPALFNGAKPQVDKTVVLNPEAAPLTQGAATMENGRLAIKIPRTAYWSVVVIPLKQETTDE